MRRSEALAEQGLRFVGAGVSGGEVAPGRARRSCPAGGGQRLGPC